MKLQKTSPLVAAAKDFEVVTTESGYIAAGKPSEGCVSFDFVHGTVCTDNKDDHIPALGLNRIDWQPPDETSASE